jgi:hypothetical protein
MDRVWQLVGVQVAQVARSEWDRAIGVVAARQHGVITSAQLAAIGLTSDAIRHRVASGRLHRLHRGVYAVGYRPLRPHGHWMAATLACGPEAVLSHASCAALYGFRASSATLIDVTSPTRAGRVRSGIRVHSAGTLRAADRTSVEGIPCTSVARLIVDLAGVLSLGSLEYLIHRCQSMGRFNRAEVRAVLDHAPSRRGTANVRRILGFSWPEEDRLNSGLERRLFRICVDGGVPVPEVNRWIAVAGADAGGFEVDFCWPQQRLIVEVDSRVYHQTDRAIENDPHRDRLLTLAGWRVIRFTERDLAERRAVVARQLAQFLATFEPTAVAVMVS